MIITYTKLDHLLVSRSYLRCYITMGMFQNWIIWWWQSWDMETRQETKTIKNVCVLYV